MTNYKILGYERNGAFIAVFDSAMLDLCDHSGVWDVAEYCIEDISCNWFNMYYDHDLVNICSPF